MFRLLFVLSTVVSITYGLKLQAVKLVDSRIVGGTIASKGEFPHQVSLRFLGNSHTCGGSIIKPSVIVTAAHCVSGNVPSRFRVVAGINSLTEPLKPLPIEKILVHEQYDAWTIEYDVALLYLVSPLVYSSTIQPIALAKCNPADGDVGVVTGWGTTREGGSLSNNLQKVTVKIVGNKSCGRSYGAGAITDTMICAGDPEGGKDACQGDSGGPLVVNKKLAGIVSWGYGCARKAYPGVYGAVAKFVSWIEENAGP